ncbi:MAG: TSUP family transporter, partial [Bacteroidota bacterium]
MPAPSIDLLSLTILTVVALIASTLSSLAGFGGSLLLLPVLVHLLGPASAIPVFTVAGLISNAARSILGRRVIAWRQVGAFVAGAIPGAIAGALVFVEVPAAAVQKLLAVFLIA